MRVTSTQIQLHSRKKDDAGPPWVRLHFRNMKMLLTVPCSYTQIQGFFVKVLNSCPEVQWCWPSLFGVLHNVPISKQAEEKLLAPTLWENTKPCMHAFFVWEWLRRISGKRWCWSSMRSTALPNMRKAATTLPDSETGFVDRVLGLIWPNSVRLQDVNVSDWRICNIRYHMVYSRKMPSGKAQGSFCWLSQHFGRFCLNSGFMSTSSGNIEVTSVVRDLATGRFVIKAAE